MRTNASNLSRLIAVTGAILLVTYASGDAGPLTVVKDENIPERFEVQLKHRAVDRDVTHTHLIAVDWLGSIRIVEDDLGAALSDTLDVTARINSHLIPPHGEGPAAGPTLGPFHIDAGSFGPGDFSLSIPTITLPHESHQDVYNFKLAFSVSSDDIRNDITNYTLTFTGVHIPEPSSLLMMGIAGLGLLGYRWLIRATRSGVGR